MDWKATPFKCDQYIDDFRGPRKPEVEGRSFEELRQLSDSELKYYIEYTWDREREANDAGAILFMFYFRDAMSLLEALVTKWYTGANPVAFMELVSGVTERTSTQFETSALWRLAEDIRKSPMLRATLLAHENGAFFTALEDYEEGRAFLRRYKEFLAEFGFRGQSDRDIFYPRRSEDPAIDYVALRTLASLEDQVDPEIKEREVSERNGIVLEEVVANIRKKPFGRLRCELVKVVHSFVQRAQVARDNERYCPTDMVTWAYKRGHIEMGRRLEERGLLESGDEIVYLSREEVYDLFDGRATNLKLVRAKIAARRRDVQRVVRDQFLPPKYLYHGEGIDLDNASAEADTGRFRGKGWAHGAVTGTARVVRELAGIGRVQPGEILIAHATDPGWSTIFFVVQGVICETGGLLSHFSCLSRELGIPAIQLEDAMDRIPDGTRISMDGATGEVRILSMCDEQSPVGGSVVED
jgi:pyruvate,water dikinase